MTGISIMNHYDWNVNIEGTRTVTCCCSQDSSIPFVHCAVLPAILSLSFDAYLDTDVITLCSLLPPFLQRFLQLRAPFTASILNVSLHLSFVYFQAI